MEPRKKQIITAIPASIEAPVTHGSRELTALVDGIRYYSADLTRLVKDPVARPRDILETIIHLQGLTIDAEDTLRELTGIERA